MHRLTGMQHFLRFTPVEEAALELVHLPHIVRHFLTLRQRSTQVGVVVHVLFIRRCHRVLIAVQHLRDTTHGR